MPLPGELKLASGAIVVVKSISGELPLSSEAPDIEDVNTIEKVLSVSRYDQKVGINFPLFWVPLAISSLSLPAPLTVKFATLSDKPVSDELCGLTTWEKTDKGNKNVSKIFFISKVIGCFKVGQNYKKIEIFAFISSQT
jgi:ribosomal 30S subunit maturation factor RimM